jgi:hypothetical protein
MAMAVATNIYFFGEVGMRDKIRIQGMVTVLKISFHADF